METEKYLFDSFLTWIQKKSSPNLSINKTKIENLPIFGNSLIATQKILKNEIVLEIPHNIFVSMEDACKDDMIKKLILNKNIYLDKKTIFALFLLFQFSLKDQSFWHEYLQILPKSYTNTITWNAKEINMLKRKDLIDSLNSKTKFAENEFLKIKDIIRRDNEAKKIIDPENLQLDEFLSIFSLIESRTLYYQNPFDPESIVGTMVPYYDFCNHAFLKDVNSFEHFYFDKTRKTYVLKAYKNFDVNEQIFICYGNYNNLHFLELYGFFPFGNISNNFIEINQEFDIKKIFKAEIKSILNGFEKKMQVIKNILPHFCKKGTKKQNPELEQIIRVQIEETNGKSKFSWEIESLIFILSSELEKLPQIENILFQDMENEIKQNALCKHLFELLKDHLLNQKTYDDDKEKNLQKTSRAFLALDYSQYETNLIKMLDYQ